MLYHGLAIHRLTGCSFSRTTSLSILNIIVRTLSNTDCYLTPLVTHPMPNRNVIPGPIPIAHSAMREDLSSAIQYASIFDWIHQT